jgi:hypothetical protein
MRKKENECREEDQIIYKDNKILLASPEKITFKDVLSGMSVHIIRCPQIFVYNIMWWENSRR